MEKILFVIPTMQQGGAERVVSTMANYWSKGIYEITVISFDNKEPYYNLSSDVKFYNLNSTVNRYGVFNFIINNFKRIKNYLKFLKIIRPDIIISFTDNANVYCLLVNLLKKNKLIITQRGNPDYITLPLIIKSLPKFIYRFADAMVLQTFATLDIYNRLKIKLPVKKEIIFNPVQLENTISGSTKHRENIVLAVGRIENFQKQFDQVIEIFADADNEEWELHIIGMGPDYEHLKFKIDQMGLGKKVFLLGNIKDITPYYQRSKIFTLTSLFEGLPNVLIEAMVNGCACISYNCPTGPSEIIDNDVNGILVELQNTKAFAQKLSLLMNNPDVLDSLSREAVKVKDLFAEDKIMKQWEILINQIKK